MTKNKKCSKCKVNDRKILSNGNVCNWCDECQSKQNSKYYKEHKEKVLAKNKKWAEENRQQAYNNNTKSRSKRRMKCIEFYSGGKLECECCKENHYEFLTIDHIEGGGTQHRKDIGNGGQALYSWVINNGFPDGFRVLCYNCNSCLGHYGFCPHKQIKNEEDKNI